jgi:hypothetical protein
VPVQEPAQPPFEPSEDPVGGAASVRDRMTNQRFGVLALRALRVEEDYEATDELYVYLALIARPWTMRFPRQERENVFQGILEAAWRATRKLLTRPIAKPRNYVVTAMRRGYVSEIRKAIRSELVSPRELTDPILERADRGAETELDLEIVTGEVAQLLDEVFLDVQSATGEKIAQLLTVCFVNHLDLDEAARLLMISESEMDTVKRTIRRDRTKPSRPVGRLVVLLQEHLITRDSNTGETE